MDVLSKIDQIQNCAVNLSIDGWTAHVFPHSQHFNLWAIVYNAATTKQEACRKKCTTAVSSRIAPSGQTKQAKKPANPWF
eukprot:scaffold151771_cov14-Tisochrysis_lutea.AAC.1